MAINTISTKGMRDFKTIQVIELDNSIVIVAEGLTSQKLYEYQWESKDPNLVYSTESLLWF
jgi:hypothetical protein